MADCRFCKECGVSIEHRYHTARYCSDTHRNTHIHRKFEQTTRKDQIKKDPAKYLHYLAKRRSKLSGIEFSIEPCDITINEVCPILNTKIEACSKNMDTAISLDRVDNTKGYIKGNVVTISRRANTMKGDMSVSDLKSIMKYIERFSNAGL